jgi:hypothetical protein
MNYKMNHSIWMSLSIIAMITIPFVAVGVLFIFSHFRNKRNLFDRNDPNKKLEQ